MPGIKEIIKEGDTAFFLKGLFQAAESQTLFAVSSLELE